MKAAKPDDGARLLVTLTAADLRELVRAELQMIEQAKPAPALLTQDGLAEELGVSGRTIFELRQRGLPVVMVCDSPRFELPAVLAWLRAKRSSHVKIAPSVRKGAAA